MGKIIDNFLKKAPGRYYGIVSAVIRFTGDFLTLLFFPDYDLTKNMISDLGIGSGAIFFNLGIIISGIVSIPFYAALVILLENDGLYEKTRRNSLIIFYIADTAYFMIGIFPSDPNNYLLYLTHGIVAFIWVLLTISYLCLFCFLMIKNSKFAKFPVIVSLFLIACLMLFMFTWVPIFEWMLSLAFFI
jgi:hypothetical membrane protein